jgi:histidinol-phosphate/aromatic aminotransferase/cobyric acid decarboxylase-like protein
MIKGLSTEEVSMVQHIKLLKKQAGTHSPSLFTIREQLPALKMKIDACFLSNPYATELFLDHFKKDLLGNDLLIRDVLEFYPSQNKVIASSLADFLDVPGDMIFIGNGAIEIIQAIIHQYTQSKIIVNIPTFSSYYEFVKPGVSVVFNKLKKENDFKLNIDDLLELADNEKPDTVVLINPNNPNGAYISKGEIMNLLEGLKEVRTVLLDESFIHFAYENEQLDPLSYVDVVMKYPNVVTIKSMSKDFGIAGIRAGYAIMHPSRVKPLLENGFLWNSNGLAEYFFKLYVQPEFQTAYEIVRKQYIKDTQKYFEDLDTIPGFKRYPSRANFALIELNNSLQADDFAFGLLVKEGIYTRTCSDKIGLDNGEFIRLASRSKEENEIIINALKSI